MADERSSNPSILSMRPKDERTLKSAHTRIDILTQTVEALVKLIGTPPNPVTREEGSGMMGYLGKIDEEKAQSRLDLERWRKVWTALAAIIATSGGVIAILDRVGFFHK